MAMRTDQVVPKEYVLPEVPFHVHIREYREAAKGVIVGATLASIPKHAVFPTPRPDHADPIDGEERFYSKEFVQSVGGSQWGPAEGPAEWLEIPQPQLWQSRTNFGGDNPWQTYPEEFQRILNDAHAAGKKKVQLTFGGGAKSSNDQMQAAAGNLFEVDFERMVQENVQDRARRRTVQLVKTHKRHWFSVNQFSSEVKPYAFEAEANTMIEEGTSEGRCQINNVICHEVTTYGHTVFVDTVGFRQYASPKGGDSRRLFYVPEVVKKLLPKDCEEGMVPHDSTLFRRLSAAFDATKFGMRARSGEVSLHEEVKIRNVKFVLNKQMYLTFMEKCHQFGDSARICLVYHGTRPDRIDAIMQSNFSLSQLGKATGDQGWFGAGVYFGRRAYTALGYNKGPHLLCCLVVLSKVFRTPMPDSDKNPYHGKPCEEGYDAHVSPTGKELVVFSQRQILPCFLLELNTTDYKDAGYNDYYGIDADLP